MRSSFPTNHSGTAHARWCDSVAHRGTHHVHPSAWTLDPAGHRTHDEQLWLMGLSAASEQHLRRVRPEELLRVARLMPCKSAVLLMTWWRAMHCWFGVQVFSKVGDVKRIVMGLDKHTLTPCGFCFVVYYTREDAEDCVKVQIIQPTTNPQPSPSAQEPIILHSSILMIMWGYSRYCDVFIVDKQPA